VHPKSLIAIMAIAFQIANPCSEKNKPQMREPGATDPVYEVEVVYPEHSATPRTHTVDGQFEASEVVYVTAGFAGEVSQVLVNEGDTVAENDPVVILSNADLNDTLDLARARLKEVDAHLKKALSSLRALGDDDRPVTTEETRFLDDEDTLNVPPPPKNYGPADDSDKKPSTLRELIATLEATSERLGKQIEVMEKKLLGLTHTSPVGGVVVKKHVAEKTKVAEQNSMLEIAKTDPMSVVFKLPDDVASFVDKHSTVKVTPVDAPDVNAEGTVYFIDPNVNTLTRTIEIKAHVVNDQGLIKGGQKAKVVVATRKIDQIMALPKKTLVYENKKMFLYIVDGSQARLREVKVGKDLGTGQIEVISSLTVDDAIIVNRPAALKNGSFVKIKEGAEKSDTL
jgi:multidrug efflux pump subunit AcrA (membrane-fusion protein)